MSRSRASPGHISSSADEMLRASLSRDNASVSSSTATVQPYNGTPGTLTPASVTRERLSKAAPSTSSRRASLQPDASMIRADLATSSRRASLQQSMTRADLAATSQRTSIRPDASRTKGDLPTMSPWSSSSTLNTRSTSSATRERLRMAEEKCDELARDVENERAVAERLKREASAADLSATEAKLRELNLKREVRATSSDSGRRSASGMFKAACSTDLLFLIDTTGSMHSHIMAAKDQVRSIMKDIQVAFLNEAEVRIGIVGYKDHGDFPNIQFLDFTPHVDRVHAFLNTLVATGGGDEPEDVLGGLKQALNASWKHQTRCIIHIADAPPHGRTLQNRACADDRYPNPGSEPHGLTHEPLLRQMLGLNINYALLRVTPGTDMMALKFFEAYAAASGDCMLHRSNQFYNRACNNTLTRGKNSGLKGGLLFEEAELGTNFKALQHLVVKMVTSSASRTAVRVSRIRGPAAANKWLDMKNLGAIVEDEDGDDVHLENSPPQWHQRGWLDETLMVEGFSPDVVQHASNTLNDMMASDHNIKMSITELTIRKRSQPFAQGAMRLAFYARTMQSANRYVVKSFKRDGKRLAHFAEDMRCQALCKAFALDFNALVGEEHSLDFIVTTCLKGKSGSSSGDECLSLEPYIEGTYVKYNNNSGFVNKDNPHDRCNQAAQAFSHFTFERSKGRFLVSDLQGVGNQLTDPAIHTSDPERFKLVDANLGKEGFKFFFSTHECNSICSKLGLKSHKSMFMSGSFRFRETWSSMSNTVCCSNKLCGRIIRLASARSSDKFPGYLWCDVCSPQLRSSMTKLICVGPGPHHEFEVSGFFYESQGRSTPRRCPEHRERGDEDITTASSATRSRTRTAVVDGGFWARLKSAKREKSMMSLKGR